MQQNPTLNKILIVIAMLLFANLSIELYKTFVPTANAANVVDCRITDVSRGIYNQLPIKISDIDSSISSSRTIPVQIKDWDTSDDVRVKVVDWDTYDEVKVKVSN